MPGMYVALIPAYEPDETLPKLVLEAERAGLFPVVVDDGSGPAYEHIFQEITGHCVVIRKNLNAGKGAALKAGLAYIQENCPADSIVVTMDADGQHTVRDALDLCRSAEENPDAILLGSRRSNENVPLRSLFGNSMTRHVYNALTGMRIHDTQTGLRAFHMDRIPFLLHVSGNRYEYEMNVLLEFARAGIPIVEKEIETLYFNGNSGSHFQTVRDSVRVYKELLKFSASSLVGFLVDYGMFSLLSVLTSGWTDTASLWFSNAFARVVSAAVNYTLNRTFVFRSTESPVQSAVRYILLAVCILVGNTLVLSFLVDTVQITRYIAKPLTEILFFVFSWVIQRTVVFSRGKS